MAVTTPTDVATSIPEKYAAAVLRDMKKDTFWSNLASKEAGQGAIREKTELLNKPGEQVHIQVTAPLTGVGQSGDIQTLEGNEEKLSTSEIIVTTTYYRHGVRVNNRAQKKSMLNLRNEARLRLAEWGRDKLDTMRFANFTAAAGANESYGTQQIRYVGGVGTVNGIVAADKLTLTEISKAKYVMKANGAHPWNIRGNKYFGLVIEDWVEYDLKELDTSYAQAEREAGVRGHENPLFTGAGAIWNGVIIYAADRVVAAPSTAATPVRVAHNLMFGKEAFVEAYGSKPSWAEDTFDYGHEFGVAYGFDYGCQRSFEDYSLQIVTSAVVAE